MVMPAQDPVPHEGGDAPRATTPIREPLPGIGERLRDRRIARGQSLEDVEEAIRINIGYLQALEEEHYDVLPAPVYARGFMRSYARYLGLDADEAVAAMSGTLQPPANLEPLPGLRRTPSTMPEFNRPLVAIIGAGIALVVLVLAAGAFLGGGSGLDLPGEGGDDNSPAASATPADSADAGALTVPATDEGIVPDFVGVARSAAVEYLDAREVRWLVLENFNDEVPAGEVFRQSPEAGATLEDGTIVTIFVSNGPREVEGAQ
jgi:transcriptional regulator with XRE-family HTH domain